MQGLMVKLLNVDAAGERALRVVAYFDQLAANKPDLESVVRATALIADCPAGLDLPDRGLVLRFDTEGRRLTGGGTPSSRSTFSTDHGETGTVWIERQAESRELDDFIVERASLASAAIVARERPSHDPDVAQGFSDPALAQLLVNDRASEAERSRAASLIGLPPSGTVQLIAVEPGPAESLTSLVARVREMHARPVFASEFSRTLAILILTTREALRVNDITERGRCASGPVVDLLDAPAAWASAREALRFAGVGIAWPKTVTSEELGVIRLLAAIEPTRILTDPDVVAIDRLAAETGGSEAIQILDRYLHSDSLRSAARALNYHHSSLQTRVGRIGASLGIDLKSPSGRERATLALLLWQLHRAG